MLEFVQALHEAFHTESRWLFILYLGLIFALAFGVLGAALAYVVDSGYQRKLRETRATTIGTPTPEENRLRAEVDRLQRALNDRNAFKQKIQDKLSQFITTGNVARQEYYKYLGMAEETQRPAGLATRVWHKSVEDYLRTLPRGSIYLARFSKPSKGLWIVSGRNKYERG